MFSERITMSAIVLIGIFSLFVTGEYVCYLAAFAPPDIDRCLQVRELIELEATLCNGRVSDRIARDKGQAGSCRRD